MEREILEVTYRRANGTDGVIRIDREEPACLDTMMDKWTVRDAVAELLPDGAEQLHIRRFAIPVGEGVAGG